MLILLLSVAISIGMSTDLRASVIGGGLLWAGDFGRGIYTIDPVSGAFVKRLDVNVGSTVMHDFAFDARSGLLYGISGGSLFGSPSTLFTINLNTPALAVNLLGTVTPPDASASYISGLTFVNGDLIASQTNGQRDALFKVNRTDLSISNVYYLPSPVNFNTSDLASPFHAGKPLGLNASSFAVFEVSSPNGPVSVLGNSPSIGGFQYGLAYAEERNLIFSSAGFTLAAINPLDFSSRLISIPNATFTINGLEYVPLTSVVPEPTSQLIFALGMVGITLRSTYRRTRSHDKR